MLIPCIPATDLKLAVLESEYKPANEALIKVKSGDGKYPVKGYKSGSRSAIIREGDHCLRLKGCGMLE